MPDMMMQTPHSYRTASRVCKKKKWPQLPVLDILILSSLATWIRFHHSRKIVWYIRYLPRSCFSESSSLCWWKLLVLLLVTMTFSTRGPSRRGSLAAWFCMWGGASANCWNGGLFLEQRVSLGNALFAGTTHPLLHFGWRREEGERRTRLQATRDVAVKGHFPKQVKIKIWTNDRAFCKTNQEARIRPSSHVTTR